jgi:IS30 family transposase
MVYLQLTNGERYVIARMRARHKSHREIARCLGRAVSTITREVKRNCCPHDGAYRNEKAHSRAMSRRSRTRKKSQYRAWEWAGIEVLLRRKWSPKQIAGRRRLMRLRAISHETIYRYIRGDKREGGALWRHTRVMSKIGRKKRGSPATRGRLVGKRHISERPAAANERRRIGDCEGDTVMGIDGRHCVLTLVDRKTRFLVMKKLSARTKQQASRALSDAIAEFPGRVKTITLDNGTEFHDYARVKRQCGVEFFFANPYHSWERGTNENTNGLIRQYLPKGTCFKELTQGDCDWIANELNDRPREILGFRTPAEMLRRARGVALQS